MARQTAPFRDTQYRLGQNLRSWLGVRLVILF